MLLDLFEYREAGETAAFGDAAELPFPVPFFVLLFDELGELFVYVARHVEPPVSARPRLTTLPRCLAGIGFALLRKAYVQQIAKTFAELPLQVVQLSPRGYVGAERQLGQGVPPRNEGGPL